jgi:hypothetical protein
MSQPLAQTVPAPASLPDVNAEITPYDLVQHLLDQTADFSLMAVPDRSYAGRATLTPGDPRDYFGINGGYGIDFMSTLHRMGSVVQPPSARGVGVDQRVGEAVGSFHGRCAFGPDDLAWEPGRLPAATIFDPYRSQRFAVVDAGVRIGEAGDGFCGYGIGRTYPVVVGGRPLLFAGAVGNLMTGSGRFASLDGTFVMTGTFTDLGFLGSVTCRVMDPEGRMRREGDLSPIAEVADPAPESTFFVLRLVKKDRHVKTTYGPPPGDGRVSLVTPSQMRSARFQCTGGHHPRTAMEVRQVVGTMDATVFFDLLAPPGSAEHPVPFSTDEVYRFVDADGQVVGKVMAGIQDGISFNLRLPGVPQQPAVRFSGFGPITGGTGPFAGLQGMLTVNSLIGISPHTLSLVHVLHFADPDGRLRGSFGA